MKTMASGFFKPNDFMIYNTDDSTIDSYIFVIMLLYNQTIDIFQPYIITILSFQVYLVIEFMPICIAVITLN